MHHVLPVVNHNIPKSRYPRQSLKCPDCPVFSRHFDSQILPPIAMHRRCNTSISSPAVPMWSSPVDEAPRSKRHAFQLWIMGLWETSTLVQWKAPRILQDPTFEVQNSLESHNLNPRISDLTGIWRDRIHRTNGDTLHFSA